MAEHTPGPWTVEYDDDGVEIRAAGDLMGTIIHGGAMDANARLIAVAPELLQVAYLAVEMGWGGEHHPDCDDEGEEPVTGCICGLSQVLAAIAKAEGRA